MRPILFEEGTTNFTTNGLGRIGAESCEVEQEVNGIYELEMVVPITDPLFDKLKVNRIIGAKPSKSKSVQGFSIYKISKPMDGMVTVNAEHVSYQLSFIPVKHYTGTTCKNALTRLKTNSLETNPFTFDTDKVISANWESPVVPTSARAILQGEEGSILQRFKGEYEFDNFNVTLKTHLGTDRGVTIKYGKNLIDMEQEESIGETYTGVCPFYTREDGTVLTLTEKVLHSANAANFPYQRTIPLDMTNDFEIEPSEQELRTAATAYMTDNNIGVPRVSLQVEFIALSDTEEYRGVAPLERVELGDTVRVEFEELGVSAEAEVVRTLYDSVLEKYIEVEIGSVKASLSSTIAAQKQQIEESTTRMEKAIQTATELINGGLGGYVRTTTNSDGQPQEILIMDSPSIADAVNVIRLNRNGIGFSTTGYSGPFNSAWTIDGTFNAGVINVINLVAEALSTVNSDETYKIDIENGQFVIYKKTNGNWVQRVALGGVSSLFNDGTVALGTLPADLSTATINSANNFIALNPLQSYFNSLTRFYKILAMYGTYGDIEFFDGAKFINKEPAWLSVGTGFLLNSGTTGQPRLLERMTAIESGDLNTYSIAGAYSISSNAIAGALANCPSSEAGILIVESSNGTFGGARTWRYIRQIYRPLSTHSYYERRGSTGSGTTYSWTDWVLCGGLNELTPSSFPMSSSGSAYIVNGARYSKLYIVGRPTGSSTIKISTVVPTALLTTSYSRWQINDETGFVSFDLRTNSNDQNIQISFGSANASGLITNIYGEN